MLSAATSVGAGALIGIVAGAVTCFLGLATMGTWTWRRLLRALVGELEPTIERIVRRTLREQRPPERMVREVDARTRRIETQVTPNGGETDELATKIVKMERDIGQLRRLLVTVLRRAGYVDPPEG